MSALPRGTLACPFTDLETLLQLVGVTPRGLGRASDIGDDAAPWQTSRVGRGQPDRKEPAPLRRAGENGVAHESERAPGDLLAGIARPLFGDGYGVGVPPMAPPTSCSQTLPIVTVGGPAKNPVRFCWTQSAARRVDSSAPA
jgi:hypothetical protein